MLTHHASNGCNLRSGDLLASGTVSGADKTARGCLLELTSRGKDPVALPSGEQRKFLEDGDEIILRGFCEHDGFRRIGLGSCRGTIQPASARWQVCIHHHHQSLHPAVDVHQDMIGGIDPNQAKT
jgi:fumarylacetoacetase